MLRLVVALTVALAGCGDDTSAATGGADLSAAVPRDMVAAEGMAFNVPQCGGSDDGCTQSWGEDYYTCRCRPDGTGRCCPDGAGPGCFSVDGG